ncbi:hypothetical protein KDW77_gp39 [Mycobacterium phage Pinnie]|uniref:Uncharacterized protein n=1 Tax=Mycobacterium phage Pinnie TaxID=2517965 RepID=A0A482J9P8_9CAUD|nr:hypothetical protein KDW77_gp39 [Mycobacterium phage Pinnie]QBP30253.1 hypothetical protein SEA_PINNIE_39 [Mycobacterium phage Pinnie]
MADGRNWPGYQERFCPICGAKTGTHREPDAKHGEVVAYHDHTEPKTGARCRFVGERAAIRAVAFSATDTGISPRQTAEENLHRAQGSKAADELLARLNERHPTR